MPDEEKKNPEVETTTEEVQTETTTVEQKPEATPAAPTQASAGSLVLQWLTYAFWGWLIIALIWLVTVVLVNAILDEDVAGAVPYAVAASLVLLPLAFFTDRAYSKREPLKKANGEAVIMVIHAVIFAISGILSLIFAVFTSINLVITTSGSSQTDTQLVALLVSGFATLAFAAAFLRTLNPFHSSKPNRIYRLSMVGVTALLLIFAIAGPIAQSIATRNDRLIERNLSSVESAISSYIQDNNKLPDNLNEIEIQNDDAAGLVKDGLVEYKKEESITTRNTRAYTTTEYRYQLCVEYSRESKNRNTYPMAYEINKKEYQSYLSTSNHGKGEECYKLQTTTTENNESETTSTL